MEYVLVAGATGTTGKIVTDLLKSSPDFEPIAMVRNQKQQAQFLAKDIKTVMGDLEQDVSHTVSRADKVIFAAGSGGKKVVAVDQEGAKKMISASENGTIKKFVMLSSMGADAPKSSYELQDYLQAKHNADEFLKTSKLNYTIVRPGTLNNSEGKGTIQLSESLNTQGEISREDVAKTLVQSLHDSVGNKQCFEILEGDTAIETAVNQIK